MKRFKCLTVIGVACFFLFACSDQSAVTTGQVEENESQTTGQVAATTPETPSEIDGILTQTEDGFTLVTDADTFILTGQDLSDMLGKKVKITGVVAEVDDAQVIQVMSVMPIE